jgi:hypothetical protein
VPNAFADSQCTIRAVCKIGRLTVPCDLEAPPSLTIPPRFNDPGLPPINIATVINAGGNYTGDETWIHVDSTARVIEHIGPDAASANVIAVSNPTAVVVDAAGHLISVTNGDPANPCNNPIVAVKRDGDTLVFTYCDGSTESINVCCGTGDCVIWEAVWNCEYERWDVNSTGSIACDDPSLVLDTWVKVADQCRWRMKRTDGAAPGANPADTEGCCDESGECTVWAAVYDCAGEFFTVDVTSVVECNDPSLVLDTWVKVSDQCVWLMKRLGSETPSTEPSDLEGCCAVPTCSLNETLSDTYYVNIGTLDAASAGGDRNCPGLPHLVPVTRVVGTNRWEYGPHTIANCGAAGGDTYTFRDDWVLCRIRLGYFGDPSMEVGPECWKMVFSVQKADACWGGPGGDFKKWGGDTPIGTYSDGTYLVSVQA